MWIGRKDKKTSFINNLYGLDRQVLLVRGARQVGKTSFILDALRDIADFPQLKLNFLYPSSFTLNGVDYLGRDFFGQAASGEEFLKNIDAKLAGLNTEEKPAVIFVDEVDRYPRILESIQTLAEFSDKMKFVLTGSNLENIPVENAATGRKRMFDLFPITFMEFVSADGHSDLDAYLGNLSLERKNFGTEFFHKQLNELLQIYIRIGGMPKIADAYLSSIETRTQLPEIVKDLAVSIEENVKTVLGERAKLYEYEDVLRRMAHLSMNTLKFTHLQVQHAGRSEAKKLVAKTVGARVSHKIRLFDSDKDLSKYIIFDCGILNYLLNGSDLLNARINERDMPILLETFVGVELIANLVTRDDLLYWKSGNMAELEYLLKSPFAGIDVKTSQGDNKSLKSFALLEPESEFLVKVCSAPLSLRPSYESRLPNVARTRSVRLVTVPHYLAGRLVTLLKEVT